MPAAAAPGVSTPVGHGCLPSLIVGGPPTGAPRFPRVSLTLDGTLVPETLENLCFRMAAVEWDSRRHSTSLGQFVTQVGVDNSPLRSLGAETRGETQSGMNVNLISPYPLSKNASYYRPHLLQL